jgi:hypothetical protein
MMMDSLSLIIPKHHNHITQVHISQHVARWPNEKAYQMPSMSHIMKLAFIALLNETPVTSQLVTPLMQSPLSPGHVHNNIEWSKK